MKNPYHSDQMIKSYFSIVHTKYSSCSISNYIHGFRFYHWSPFRSAFHIWKRHIPNRLRFGLRTLFSPTDVHSVCFVYVKQNKNGTNIFFFEDGFKNGYQLIFLWYDKTYILKWKNKQRRTLINRQNNQFYNSKLKLSFCWEKCFVRHLEMLF